MYFHSTDHVLRGYKHVGIGRKILRFLLHFSFRKLNCFKYCYFATECVRVTMNFYQPFVSDRVMVLWVGEKGPRRETVDIFVRDSRGLCSINLYQTPVGECCPSPSLGITHGTTQEAAEKSHVARTCFVAIFQYLVYKVEMFFSISN